MVGSADWPVPAVIIVTAPPPVTPTPAPFNLIPLLAGAGGAAFILIVVIVIVCVFVVRARRRRKNLALLVQQLERFKSRQANRSFLERGLSTLNETLGFGAASKPRTLENEDTLKKGKK